MDTVTGYEMTKAMTDNGQYAVVSRFLNEADWLKTFNAFAGHPRVFFSVGLGADKVRPELLESDIALNIAVDIAHGDMEDCHTFTVWLSEQKFVNHVMSGSVCTGPAAVRAAQAGCSYIRVGVGPGSVCSTRIMTGCGYPQLSAVYETRRALDDLYDFDENLGVASIVADGGIRHPGDVVKYLSAGADTVMLGSVLGMAIEAPGWVHDGWKPLSESEVVSFPQPEPEPIFVKEYRGQASASFQRDYGKNNDCPEGVSRMVTYQGDTVESIVRMYTRGISRGVSYVGLDALYMLGPDTVDMVEITGAGLTESRPQR